MLDDLRFLWRSAGRAAWSAVTVVALLGVAVGATAAVAAIVDALVVRPLGVKDEHRLVHLGGLARPQFIDAVKWWGQAQTLDGLAMYESGELTVEGSGGLRPARAAVVSAGFFPVFHLRAAAGRLLTETDADAHRVAVLSHTFGRAFFGAQPPVGAPLRLNGIPHIIIGVAPEGFDFPQATDIWLPQLPHPLRETQLFLDAVDPSRPRRASGWVGRLRVGMTRSAAREDFHALLKRLHDSYSSRTGTRFGDIINVTPLRTIVAGDAESPLRALLAGAGLMLLAAAANCATVLLGRAAARRSEIAIRQVVGATPFRIVGQAATEAVTLGLAGALVGFLVALGSLTAARALFPAYVDHMPARSTLLAVTFGVSVLLSVAVGLFAGLAPALQSISPRTFLALKDQGGALPGGRGRTLRRVLVAAEIAVALVLTSGAVLAFRTFLDVAGADLGFDPRGAVVVRVGFSSSSANRDAFLARQQEILDTARAIPGVAAAGAIHALTLGAQAEGGLFVRRDDVHRFCLTSTVTGDYFRAMGIAVVAGRAFTREDRDVLILNETAARELWTEGSPVGRELWIDGEPGPRRVVGVVKNTRAAAARALAEAQMYLPYTHAYRGQSGYRAMDLIARCRNAECAGMAARLATDLPRASAGVTVRRVSGLEDLVRSVVAPLKARAILLGAYCLLGLAVAFAGIYTLVSYLSALRTYEMGVRAALGAAPRDVVVLLVREGLKIAVLGVLLGVMLSRGATRLLASLLYGVTSLDAATLVAASTVLLVGAAVAAAVPAVRAARVSPWEILRNN